MKATVVDSRRLVWAAEVVLAALTTLALLPMLLLYAVDLATRSIAPGTAVALGAVIGVSGLWVALLAPDSRIQGKPAIQWATAAALALATALLAHLAWGSVRAEGMTFAFVPFAAAAGVALHQFLRVVRL